MNNFQTILVAIFLAFFVFGVLVFSGLIDLGKKSNKDGISGSVVVWGTFPSSTLGKVIDVVKNPNLNITYVQKNESTYQQDLVEAFANGKGPDLYMITADMIKKNNNFIYKIPYASYPEKTFRDYFIDGADIFMDKDGIIAFPVVVDPIVLYYNKNILSNDGIVAPPKTWDELFTMNPVLTKRETVGSGTLMQSMIALGQFSNINNAKDILASLLLQNDNQIVRINDDSTYTSVLNANSKGSSISPIMAVLEFYTAFSNPSDTSYSWNRSLPTSFDTFTGGKLAFYLGYASELFKIDTTNTNLSFNVTSIPQVKGASIKRTFGKIYSVAINKKSSNLTTALGVANLISTGDGAKEFSTASSLPPASRTLLADKPADDNYMYTFFNSSLITRSWIDPDKAKTENIFESLLENILSNRLSKGEAINKAQSQLELLLK